VDLARLTLGGVKLKRKQFRKQPKDADSGKKDERNSLAVRAEQKGETKGVQPLDKRGG
jgi:hypothetical protein